MMEKSKKRRLWFMGLLVVSLAFNLLIAGMLLGRAASPMRGHHPHLGWMMHELDKETRAELRDSLKAHRQASKSIRTEMKAAQQGLHALLGNEDFDAAATREALADLRDISGKFQTLAHQQMLDTLVTMKPEERVHVYKFLARPVSPGRGCAEKSVHKEIIIKKRYEE